MSSLKPSNNYVILSRDASSDANDQMFSIFKIIDSINFNTPPEEAAKFRTVRVSDKTAAIAVSIRYVVCTSWTVPEVTDKEVPVKFECTITDPTGFVASAQMQEAVFPKGNDIFRFNIVTEGFPYTEDGKYTVGVKFLDSDSKLLSEASATVRVAMNIQSTR